MLFFKKKSVIIGFGLALVIISLLLFRNLLIPRYHTATPDYYDPYPKLLNENPDFSTAERLLGAGDTDAAISYYQKALALATDKNEEYQIKYQIAFSRDKTAQIGQGIEELKSIAANPAYSTKQHAYAVQAIGELFYRNLDNPAIVSLVFTGSPYADFYKEKNTLLALRRLYEYAISFYPMALAEMRAAHWYGLDLVRLSQKKPLTVDEQKRWDADMTYIRNALAKADENIERTVIVQSASRLIPDALTRKAQVLGDLKIAGIPSDPEEAFKHAIIAGLANGNEVSPRYAYAEFLAKAYGTSRATDIKSNLSVIYSNIDKNRGFKSYWSAEKSNIAGQKETVIKLATIDPEFKKILFALGWSEADFN